MQFQETPHCCLCKSSTLSPRPQAAYDYITGQHFSLFECQRCSLLRTWPQPEDLTPYYPLKYRKYRTSVLFVLRQLYKARVEQWSRLFPAPGSALEVGCGDGLMLSCLRQKGWMVAGTERTEEMAHSAFENHNINVYVDGRNDLPRDATFDLIILFQALEHLRDPVSELLKFSSFLKPGGKIIISVPNVRSWQARFGGSRWFHLDVPRHLSHFSPQSLQAVGEYCGLKVSKISFISPEHDPYGWVQTLLNKCFAEQNRLTKLLMGMTSPTWGDLLQCLLAVVVGMICIVLSPLSWLLSKGAIMQLVLVRQ